MPRSGPNGTYTLPGAQATQQPGTPIPSAVNNQGWSDVEQTFNTPTPIAYGGTNATNAADARTNLGIPANITQMATVVETLGNVVVNGDMQVSQENGNNSGTANGFFGADQWATYRVTSAGVITTQRVVARTPAGGSYRYRVTITTPDASLAAGEYLTITQPLEGSNVQAFLYGTAGASASVIRFGFNAPAGTYAARFGNSAANRSFVALFTIAGGQANTDTVQEISIPGDTTGTWLTADGVIGITLDIVLACGSTFQGATGWQAGNILGTSAVSNGMGTGSSVFELFDVGLKLDPDATGVYGQYEVGEVDAVYRSERYYEKISGANVLIGVGFAIDANSASAVWNFGYKKSKTATISGSTGADEFGVQNSSTTFGNFEFSTSFKVSTISAGVTIATGAGLTPGQVAMVYTNQATSSLVASARL